MKRQCSLDSPVKDSSPKIIRKKPLFRRPADPNNSLIPNLETVSDNDDILTSISEKPVNPLYNENLSSKKIALPEAKLLEDDRFWREQVNMAEKRVELVNKLDEADLIEMFTSETSADTFTPNKKKVKLPDTITRWYVSLGGEDLLIVGHEHNGGHAVARICCKRISRGIFYDNNGTLCSLIGTIDPKADVPKYIAEKFKTGIPDDWVEVIKIWRQYKLQDSPEKFKWPPLHHTLCLNDYDSDIEIIRTNNLKIQNIMRKINKLKTQLHVELIRDPSMAQLCFASQKSKLSTDSKDITTRTNDTNSLVPRRVTEILKNVIRNSNDSVLLRTNNEVISVRHPNIIEQVIEEENGEEEELVDNVPPVESETNEISLHLTQSESSNIREVNKKRNLGDKEEANDDNLRKVPVKQIDSKINKGLNSPRTNSSKLDKNVSQNICKSNQSEKNAGKTKSIEDSKTKDNPASKSNKTLSSRKVHQSYDDYSDFEIFSDISESSENEKIVEHAVTNDNLEKHRQSSCSEIFPSVRNKTNDENIANVPKSKNESLQPGSSKVGNMSQKAVDTGQTKKGSKLGSTNETAILGNRENSTKNKSFACHESPHSRTVVSQRNPNFNQTAPTSSQNFTCVPESNKKELLNPQDYELMKKPNRNKILNMSPKNKVIDSRISTSLCKSSSDEISNYSEEENLTDSDTSIVNSSKENHSKSPVQKRTSGRIHSQKSLSRRNEESNRVIETRSNETLQSIRLGPKIVDTRRRSPRKRVQSKFESDQEDTTIVTTKADVHFSPKTRRRQKRTNRTTDVQTVESPVKKNNSKNRSTEISPSKSPTTKKSSIKVDASPVKKNDSKNRSTEISPSRSPLTKKLSVKVDASPVRKNYSKNRSTIISPSRSATTKKLTIKIDELCSKTKIPHSNDLSQEILQKSKTPTAQTKNTDVLPIATKNTSNNVSCDSGVFLRPTDIRTFRKSRKNCVNTDVNSLSETSKEIVSPKKSSAKAEASSKTAHGRESRRTDYLVNKDLNCSVSSRGRLRVPALPFWQGHRIKVSGPDVSIEQSVVDKCSLVDYLSKSFAENSLPSKNTQSQSKLDDNDSVSYEKIFKNDAFQTSKTNQVQTQLTSTLLDSPLDNSVTRNKPLNSSKHITKPTIIKNNATFDKSVIESERSIVNNEKNDKKQSKRSISNREENVKNSPEQQHVKKQSKRSISNQEENFKNSSEHQNVKRQSKRSTSNEENVKNSIERQSIKKQSTISSESEKHQIETNNSVDPLGKRTRSAAKMKCNDSTEINHNVSEKNMSPFRKKTRTARKQLNYGEHEEELGINSVELMNETKSNKSRISKSSNNDKVLKVLLTPIPIRTFIENISKDLNCSSSAKKGEKRRTKTVLDSPSKQPEGDKTLNQNCGKDNLSTSSRRYETRKHPDISYKETDFFTFVCEDRSFLNESKRRSPKKKIIPTKRSAVQNDSVGNISSFKKNVPKSDLKLRPVETQFKVPKPKKIRMTSLPSDPNELYSFVNKSIKSKRRAASTLVQKTVPTTPNAQKAVSKTPKNQSPKKRRLFENGVWLQSEECQTYLSQNNSESERESPKFSLTFGYTPAVTDLDDNFSEISALIV